MLPLHRRAAIRHGASHGLARGRANDQDGAQWVNREVCRALAFVQATAHAIQDAPPLILAVGVARAAHRFCVGRANQHEEAYSE